MVRTWRAGNVSVRMLWKTTVEDADNMEREPVIKRRRRKQPVWRYIPPAEQARQNTVASLKPLQQTTSKRTLKPRKLLVFREGAVIVVSIVSSRGTVSFPMARKSAAYLLGQLATQL